MGSQQQQSGNSGIDARTCPIQDNDTTMGSVKSAVWSSQTSHLQLYSMEENRVQITNNLCVWETILSVVPTLSEWII